MITTITENDIEQAFENLDRAESRYRAAQEHLTATHDQFQRNRKTLELARQEADNLNREWKQALRDANAKPDKAVMEKMEASTKARTVAQELEPILESAPEILEAAEIEALTARKAYLTELEACRDGFHAHNLNEDAEKITETAEFASFIYSLSIYLKHAHGLHLKEARLQVAGYGPGAITSDDIKSIERMALNQTREKLMSIMQKIGLNLNAEDIDRFKALPETAQESQSKLKGSPLRQKQARERLAASA
jgi:hypothetical protein